MKQEESQPTISTCNTLSSTLLTFMLQLSSISIFIVLNRTGYLLKYSRHYCYVNMGLSKSLEGLQDPTIPLFLHLGA